VLVAGALDQWLLGGPDRLPAPAVESPAYSFAARGDAGPLVIAVAPRQTTMLVVSLVVLVIGIGLYAAAPQRAWLGAGVALALLVVLQLLLPDAVPALLYAAGPGLAVLALVLGVLWLRQRRWRKRVEQLPGFTRTVPGSSLTRAPAPSPAAGREPSTVVTVKPAGAPAQDGGA
jgi:hypothetical protein